MLLLAVAVNPNFGVGHGNLAILYAMMGQNDQAKANLKRVVELGVRNPMTEN
ncbi:MAG: tetratricopeptide repeat protein [Nitrospinaceae bacterium]|nr:tetratricopeptide repeat protein [Nitrospinaceae bacterium]